MRWRAVAIGVIILILILVSWWALTTWLMSTHHDVFDSISKSSITKGIPTNDRPHRPATM